MAEHGEHEAGTPGKGIGDYLAVHAKALVATVASLVGGEALLILSDTTFVSQVQGAVPPGYSFLVPIVVAGIVGALTHQVPNKPQE